MDEDQRRKEHEDASDGTGYGDGGIPECSICLAEATHGEQWNATNCATLSHMFHEECITKYKDRGDLRCPVRRHELDAGKTFAYKYPNLNICTIPAVGLDASTLAQLVDRVLIASCRVRVIIIGFARLRPDCIIDNAVLATASAAAFGARCLQSLREFDVLERAIELKSPEGTPSGSILGAGRIFTPDEGYTSIPPTTTLRTGAHRPVSI